MSRGATRSDGKRLRAVAIRGITAAFMLMGAVIAPRPASAYVRYLSMSGCPYAWRTRNITIHEFPSGLDELDDATIGNAATQAAKVWGTNDPTQAACTDLGLTVAMEPREATPPTAKFDHMNNLVFRNELWCADAVNDCSDMALAITTVFARTWGEIVDADIEVNALTFTWADLTPGDPPGKMQDLQNALTHEIGHLLGLDHTCYLGNVRTTQVDNNGDAIPSCHDTDLPASIRATTMFASADPGDVSKRTLEPDDQLAICDAYPRGRIDPLQCSSKQTNTGGCAIAPVEGADSGGRDPRFGLWFGVIAAAIAAGTWAGTRRRRRRAR